MEKPKITVGELYPDLSGDDLKVAECNLTSYLEVIIKISERLAKQEDRSDNQPIF
jgi:hypothetical protein